MRVGIWNCEHSRNDPFVARTARQILLGHDLDALLLGETREYTRELNHLADCRFLHFDGAPGQHDTGILVRDGVPVTGLHVARMTRKGWITVRGGRTPAKWLPSCILNGWLRVGVVHLPPSVRFTGRLPSGPVRRVAAFAVHAQRLVRWIKRRRQDRALFIGGDWNAVPGPSTRWHPGWIAERTGLEVAAPKQGTHGRRVIDYALVRGVEVTDIRVGDKYGSDHSLVVYDLKETP